MTIHPSHTPDRLVLEGVPRVHFYEGGERCPEDIILPSVMRAVVEFLGDTEYGCKHCLVQNPDCKVMCTYAFLTGVSGAASFLSWKEGWHEDNMASVYITGDPGEPERRIFEATGYAYERLAKVEGRDSEALFRRRIWESIQRGVPVIGYGIIGPPEAAIITGYDEGGDVLLGWSFFQNVPEFNAGVEFEPTGYFRKRDWFRDTEGLLVIGERRDKPSLDETYRSALGWMLEVTRTPLVRPGREAPEQYRERHNGLSAYTAWADHLLRDEDFPAGDEVVLRARHEIHNAAVGTLAEARWYGATFLTMADHFAAGPGRRGSMGDILHAAAYYAAEHDLMWVVWELAGGIGNPDGYRALADPAVRRAMAGIILQARDSDARAADHIERA
ncbi:MAG: hypothetical protein MUQ10_04925 [Anaerolineae bacterium]|nr:hypothetical protein [Anaerolineae bacterium]